MLVGLTGLYSNQIKKILDFKKSLSVRSLTEAGGNNSTSSDENSIAHFRRIGKYGDTEVVHYKQKQKHDFSEKEVAEMIRRYKTGETVYELAAAFGCHRSTVSAVLKRNGVVVTLVKSEKMFDPTEAAALYEDGMKSKEIGKRFGVSEQTIRDCLKKQGVKMRTRWDYPRE